MQAARLPEDMTVAFPDLAVTYPKGFVLQRLHLLALRIIHDSIAQRPIYFSAQGGMLSELGLAPWGVRQGLVTKLEPRPKTEMARGGLVQGSDSYGGLWFDLDRSLRLYQDVYRYRSIRDRPIWPDGAAVSIPLQYYAMALLLADVAHSTGQPADLVDRLQNDALSFQLVSEGGLEVAGTQ